MRLLLLFLFSVPFRIISSITHNFASKARVMNTYRLKHTLTAFKRKTVLLYSLKDILASSYFAFHIIPCQAEEWEKFSFCTKPWTTFAAITKIFTSLAPSVDASRRPIRTLILWTALKSWQYNTNLLVFKNYIFIFFSFVKCYFCN